jgi:hypothetical protein
MQATRCAGADRLAAASARRQVASIAGDERLSAAEPRLRLRCAAISSACRNGWIVVADASGYN